MYSLHSFLDKLEKREFTFALNGHKINLSAEELAAEMAESIKWFIVYDQEKAEDTEDEEAKARAERRLEAYKCEDYIKPNKMIFAASVDCYCFNCGQTLRPILISDSEISFGKYKKDALKTKDFQPEIPACEITNVEASHTVTIQAPTGNLLFANFFREFPNCPPELEYNAPYKLDTILGRRNRSNFLAEQNVAWQQTGNMSVKIYVSKARDEIVVVSYEVDKVKGFECVGSISCEMWRWMCADSLVLEAANFQREDMDYVPVTVSPGTWEVTDYYQTPSYQPPIMARLRRTGDLIPQSE